MTASGLTRAIAARTEAASSASPIKASAPISVSMCVDSGDFAEPTKPNTLCPCCFRPRINGRPMAPVAPASRTLISHLLNDQVRQGIVFGTDDEYGEQHPNRSLAPPPS